MKIVTNVQKTLQELLFPNWNFHIQLYFIFDKTLKIDFEALVLHYRLYTKSPVEFFPQDLDKLKISNFVDNSHYYIREALNGLGLRNQAKQVRVPRHCDVEGNEKADELARECP